MALRKFNVLIIMTHIGESILFLHEVLGLFSAGTRLKVQSILTL